MVVRSMAALDATFHALGHPTRRAMLRMLAGGERTVGELAAPFRVSLAASSKHVRVLEQAGLVSRKVEGREHTCRLDPAPLRLIVDWTEEFRERWEPNFARLDAVLDRLKAERTGPKAGARRPR